MELDEGLRPALKNTEMSVLEVSDNQNVDLREFVNPQIVSLVGGQQTVQFNDRDYNIADAVKDNSICRQIQLRR